MVGRKSIFDKNPDQIQRVIANIRRGMSHADACRAEMLNYKTFEDWLTDGRKEGAKPHLAELVEAVEAAYYAGISSDLHMIEMHGFDDWRAIAWLLARKDPEKYGAVRTVRLGGEAGGSPIRTETAVDLGIDFSTWAPEDAEAYADLLERNGEAEPEDE